MWSNCLLDLGADFFFVLVGSFDEALPSVSNELKIDRCQYCDVTRGWSHTHT